VALVFITGISILPLGFLSDLLVVFGLMTPFSIYWGGDKYGGGSQKHWCTFHYPIYFSRRFSSSAKAFSSPKRLSGDRPATVTVNHYKWP